MNRTINPRCSNGYSDGSSSEQSIENPEDHFLFDGPSPRFTTISPKFVCPDPYKGWEGITHGGRDDFEELCKDVQCIELEESVTGSTEISNTLTCEGRLDMLPPTMTDSVITTDQTSLFNPQNDDEYLSEGQSEYTDGAVEQKFQDVQKTIDCVNNPLPDRPIYSQGAEDISDSRSLSRSSSGSAKLMNGSFSPSFQKAETNESTPPSGFEKEFPGRPQDIPRSFSTRNCNTKSSYISRQNSLTSAHSDVTDELKAHNTKNSAQDDVTSIHTFVAGLKETTKLQSEKPLVENQVMICWHLLLHF